MNSATPVWIAPNISGGDADGVDPSCKQKGVPRLILRSCVLLAIDLNAEAMAGAIEVENKRAERVLATQAVSPDAGPDQNLGQRHLPTETFRAFLRKDRRSNGPDTARFRPLRHALRGSPPPRKRGRI